MLTTAIEKPKFSLNQPDVRNASTHCQVCGTKIDLSKSVILKKDRVVGCPDCDWGIVVSGRA